MDKKRVWNYKGCACKIRAGKRTTACLVFLSLMAATFFIRGSSVFSAIFDKGEKIDRIEFFVNDDPDLPQVRTKAYCVGKNESKKLSSGDVITVNDQVMKGENYNNGIAAGYKYTLSIERSRLYELKVIRNGVEIKRQVKPQYFLPTLPGSISIGQNLEIPIRVEADSVGRIFVEITALDKKSPILKNDKYRRGLSLRAIESTGKLVVGSNQLQNLKAGDAELSVARISGDTYTIVFKKKVEIRE